MEVEPEALGLLLVGLADPLFWISIGVIFTFWLFRKREQELEATASMLREVKSGPMPFFLAPLAEQKAIRDSMKKVDRVIGEIHK